MKEVPVYTLTVAKGGSKLHPSDLLEGENVTPRTPSLAAGLEPRSGRLIFTNESMPDFAWALSRMAGIGDRVGVDNTGLEGRYNFELTFERDIPLPNGADLREPAIREGPSIFSAARATRPQTGIGESARGVSDRRACREADRKLNRTKLARNGSVHFHSSALTVRN
jgi:uncharacterized protein (TIGR03435 family)